MLYLFFLWFIFGLFVWQVVRESASEDGEGCQEEGGSTEERDPGPETGEWGGPESHQPGNTLHDTMYIMSHHKHHQPGHTIHCIVYHVVSQVPST